MAYRSYLRSVLNDNFKILTWLLILFIAITPNFIFMQSARAANVGGWSMGNPVVQGASVVYEGTKNIVLNGADYVKKGTAKITPTAANVAKTLGKGLAGVALSVAVEQLLGAVDFVLDPENNRIKYTSGMPDAEYWYVGNNPSVHSSTYENAANGIRSWYCQRSFKVISQGYSGSNYVVHVRCVSSGGSTNNFYIYGVKPVEEEKYYPIPALAQQVVNNANSNDETIKASAIPAISAAAADIVAEAETDSVKARPIAQQLEISAQTKPADEAAAEKANEAQGEAKPNEANPEVTDIALEFPEFCNWSPIVCEAAQTAVNFMTDFEPENESSEVTIHEDNEIIFDDSERISFSSSCPAPEQFSVSFFGASQDLEFSYQPLCDFMSMIKPFVVAGSYLIGAYIVMGLSRGSAE